MQEYKIEKEYPYVMGWTPMLFLIATGILLSVFMGYEAKSNNSGLTINGIIELGASGASVFFWSMSVFMGLVALLGVLGIIERMRGKSRIAITKDGVILPSAPWKTQENYFTFDSILELKMKQMNKTNFLHVKTDQKTYLIAENRFSKLEEFEDICSILAGQCKV